jgi:hypothetical protein
MKISFDVKSTIHFFWDTPDFCPPKWRATALESGGEVCNSFDCDRASTFCSVTIDCGGIAGQALMVSVLRGLASGMKLAELIDLLSGHGV